MAENVGSIYYNVTADTSQLVGQTRVVDRETQRMAASFNAITTAVKIYAAALALVKAAQLADEMRLLTARVQVAAGSIEAGAVALDNLRAISVRTQTELAANVAVFNRLNQSILQMGGTQNDTLRITELLGKAIKVSGASGVEASSAMTQFGQALGSGKLAGDELRSLLENAPYLMQQLARGIGVPVGALKQLGEEGKLTADVVVNALSKAAESIEADFTRLPATVSGAFAQVTDAYKQLNLALDDASGKSAVLAGASQGLAEVMRRLTDEIKAANAASGELNRNDDVKKWADRTRYGLSYVLDAGDFIKQKIEQLIAAGGLLNRIVGAPMVALAERVQKITGTAKPNTAGQRMRDLFDAGAGGGRGFVNPDPAPSQLKPPETKPDKPKGAAFDQAAYLAGLERSTAEGLDRVNLIEQEALRKNQQMLKEGKISRETAARAVTLIELNAVNERRDIVLRAAEEYRAYIEKAGEQETALAKKQADERARGQNFARGVIGAGDELTRLQQELEAKSALLAQYAAQDQANFELYAAAKVALEKQTQEEIAAIVAKRQADALGAQSALLAGYGSLFGSLADLTKNFAGEQSSAYRAMFAVSKAFAIADSIVKIQQGIANAMSLPYPANIAAAASTASAAAGLVSTIKGTNFGGGRMTGGGVGAGTMVRVNEAGRPEIFTAANGAQYMLPTADGKVSPGGAGGGGGNVVQVFVENNAAGTRATASSSDDGRIVRIVISEIVDGIENNTGPVMGALKRATNVRSAL